MVRAKKFWIIIFVFNIASGSFAFINRHINESKSVLGVAICELFTFEGCASCLPADELLAKIEKKKTTKTYLSWIYPVDY